MEIKSACEYVVLSHSGWFLYFVKEHMASLWENQDSFGTTIWRQH